MASGRLVRALVGHEERVVAVAVTRDTEGIIGGTASFDAEGRLWRVPSGRPISVLPGHLLFVEDIEFEPARTS